MAVSKIFLSRLYSCRQKSLYVYSRNRTIQAAGSANLYERRSAVISDGPNYYNVPRRWHGGHSHHHDGRSTTEGENIFRIGLAADICLATGKAFTGYVSGSTAMIADAAHSISDVVLSGAALLSFKAGRVPKDKEHPYGRF